MFIQFVKSAALFVVFWFGYTHMFKQESRRSQQEKFNKTQKNKQISEKEIKTMRCFEKEETFFFGEIEVVLINPNSYLPVVYSERAVQRFEKQNQDNYRNTFRSLAQASRAFYLLTTSLDHQKELVSIYLNRNNTQYIREKTGLSVTTITELKRGNRRLESLKMENFEKLYSEAKKEVEKTKAYEY